MLLPCISQPLILKMVTSNKKKDKTTHIFFSVLPYSLMADGVGRMCAYQEVKFKKFSEVIPLFW